MMTKLMITALLFCSSLSLAGDLSTAPKKKPLKTLVISPASTSDAQKVDETVFGGSGSLGTGGLGSAGTSAPKSKPKMVRAATPAPTK